MNKYTNLLIKFCKKIKINKIIYFISNFFCSNSSENNINYLECRKEVNDYYNFKKTDVISDNNINDFIYDLQIIVPVYNVEKYIKKCLDSIICQKTNYSFCVYVINDGSNDNSAEIIEDYEKYSNFFIINQKNNGLAGARNVGLKNIYAKYIMFVDSDDYLSDNCVENLLSTAFNKDADIVEGSYISFNNKRKIVYEKKDKKLYENQLSGFAWGKVYKSELFSNLIFPEGYIYEDTMLYFMLFPLAENIYSISNIVYYHLINENGIAYSTIGNKKSIDSYWLTELFTNLRKELNYVNDEVYQEKILKQILMNYERTKYLPTNIKKDIFYLECEIIDKLNIMNSNIKLYEYMKNRNYNKYSHYVKWN